ncbi:MAG: CotH kinase family protein [candidate division Zixibacteria bacterium]|nr:CotH kinase family protein [Candidatus Tariuqbacter arcticus]
MKKRLIIIVCLLFLPAIHANLSAESAFYGINCWNQAPSFTTPQGNLFIPDLPYSAANGFGYQGGNSCSTNPRDLVGGTEGLTPLYTGRRAWEYQFSYLFDLNAGFYAVTLYLCELVQHGDDFRVFSISIDGDTLVQDLDIFEVVGKEYALPQRFLVNCLDGQLDVTFIPVISGGTVSALSVQSVSSDVSPPQPVQGFNAIGGYEMNILYWEANTEPDLAGYKVYRRMPGSTWELVMPELNQLSRYLDYIVSTGITYEYKVIAQDFWGNQSGPSDSLTAIAVPSESSQLPIYEMTISEENLYILNGDIWSEEYVDADLTLEGEFFQGAGVRYRGDMTRYHSKKNYKLNLPPGMSFNDRDKLNLQAEFFETTMIKDRLCYQTFDLLNCLNPLYNNVHLKLNGKYIGVYLDTEQIDNKFLQRNGFSTAGNLYKCYSDLSILPTLEDYQEKYTKENNPESSWDDIIDFIQWVNLSTPEDFHNEAGAKFTLDDYLDNYTVLIASGDLDFTVHNYFMYINPIDERWRFICFDHDFSFINPQSAIDLGTEESPYGDFWNKLLDRVLEDSLFRYAYCKKLERFLDDGFAVENVQNMITAVHQDISYDAIRDVYEYGWEEPDSFLNGLDYLNEFVEARIPFLQGEIPDFITDPDLTAYFRLNEIQSGNQSTIQDEAGDYDPWIEITNIAPVELDLEGFTLHCGEDSWTLPAEALVDDYGFLILWLDGEPDEGALHCNFTLPLEGGGLLLKGPEGETADSVAYPSRGEDEVWAREEDGVGEWSLNLNPTPGISNNTPAGPFALVINELLAFNDNVNPDPVGEYDDWAEIYNLSAYTIPLEGLYLTDDFFNPNKWVFPDTSILPGSFILVWCDDEPEQGPMHASFRLSGSGEQIGIYDQDGITPINTITFPQQTTDISYGRLPDGTENWLSLNPTPGTRNIALYIGDWSLPQRFVLDPNRPNPFNSSTIIHFELPRASYVTLKIFDILGREVTQLQDGILEAGYYDFNFDASGLASGIYFCHLRSESFVSTRKMLLLR